MSGFSNVQQTNNDNWILNLITIYSRASISAAQRAKVQSLVNQYLTDQNILLAELQASQEIRFNQLIESLLSPSLSAAEILARLNTWKNKSLVQPYAGASSGFVQTLEETGSISFSQWGTDLDITQCLQDQISSFAILTREQLVANNARHIIKPVSLTESVGGASGFQIIQTALQEVQNKVQALKVDDTVQVSIPVNSHDHHWRMVKVTLKQQKISAVDLWDSFGPQPHIKETQAYLNLTKAVAAVQPNIAVTLSFAGIQKNSVSCADFVIQKSIQDKYAIAATDDQAVVMKKLDQARACAPIMLARSDAKALRTSVVKKIVGHHPAFGEVAANSIDVTKHQNHVVLGGQAPENAFADLGVSQVEFDAMMAARLQKLYQEDESSSQVKHARVTRATKHVEDLLVGKAYAQAYAFFKKQPVMKSTEAPAFVELASDKVKLNRKLKA